MQLTFLIVGLGSMGKRRIRNLRFNGEEKIIGFDIRIDRRKETETKYNIQTIDDFKILSPDNYDVLIIRR
jgi:prephenate dehydrogenase